MKLGNDKEITTSLTVPGTVGTAVGRDVWSKILGKTNVEKLINKGGCFKDRAMLNRKPMQFLKHRSYTTILQLALANYISGCTILDALLCTKIELLKSEPQ